MVADPEAGGAAGAGHGPHAATSPSPRTALAAALPLSSELGRTARRALACAFAVLVACILTIAARVLFGVGGQGLAAVITGPLNAGALVVVALTLLLRAARGGADRRAWTLIGVGTASYAIAAVLWWAWLQHVPHLGAPSVCDVMWLAFYPLSYAAILTFGRSRAHASLTAGVWLDGIIVAVATIAIGATFALPTILAGTKGSPAAVTTALAYPVGDLGLIALVLGLIGVRVWRVDRAATLLAISLLCLAGGDGAWQLQVASGNYLVNSTDALIYIVAFTVLAAAAWQRPQPAPEVRGQWSTTLVPIATTVAMLGLVVDDHFDRVPLAAFMLAMLALVLTTMRLALAMRDMFALSVVRRQAMTDDLTELPNRRLFSARLREAIANTRLSDAELVVLMLDLDNFKQLNDTLGHEAGDELLRLIGPRLKQALRASDTVARLGGDEFAVLLHSPPDPAGVTLIAEKLLGALRTPFQVQGVALRLTASVGIARFPLDADSPEQLMKCADVALYLAKASSQGWEHYSSEKDTNTRERLLLASDLASALENGEIVAHFQPIVDANTARIVGAEALARWQRPDGRVLLPGQFIDAAEHAGLSRPLTQRMVELALEQARVWRQAGHELYISVNTSVADLLDSCFPDEVAVSLAAAGVPAHGLVLEVTERSILSDPLRLGAVLDRLRRFGVEVALDDFGTGYSSLAHLRTLPVAQLKIDRSFVAGMSDQPADVAIVYATIELAHKLGLTVVAEGVEDESTLEALRELGCDRVQGYALGHPVDPADFPLASVTAAPPAQHRLDRSRRVQPGIAELPR